MNSGGRSRSSRRLGLRHRDLRPATVLVRTRDPLDLVITGFGSARLSDFDLEAVAPLELTRYSAPEVIVGAVSAASDWWSLGMIVLEQATAGACFEGINDQAFRIHVVTRGIGCRRTSTRTIRLLLRGLARPRPAETLVRARSAGLARGRAGRSPARGASSRRRTRKAPPSNLAGSAITRPETFALAAAEAAELGGCPRAYAARLGSDLARRARRSDARMVAQVRRLAADEDCPKTSAMRSC